VAPVADLQAQLNGLDLSEQQAPNTYACFIHAGFNSIVKATRDEDPNGWLLKKVNETIQVDPKTGDYTFNWANGTKTTLTTDQVKDYTKDVYKGKPSNPLMAAVEMAWFQTHPEQVKKGGYAHSFYKELFGLNAGYMRLTNPDALSVAREKGTVSTLAGHTNHNTFHVWSLDYEGPTWDLNNSDTTAGFKYMPEAEGQKNLDYTDEKLNQTVSQDKDAYISYFKIPA
jgi:hypothetical protein